MKVYAESNFLLEIVLQQSEAAVCDQLLSLAEAGTIELMLPAFAVFESADKLDRTRAEWGEFRKNHGQGLRRSSSKFKHAAEALLIAEQELATRQRALFDRIMALSTLIPMDRSILVEAERLREHLDLKRPDALVLSSVLTTTKQDAGRSVFPNTNTKDFDDPSIIAALRERDCKYVRSFKDALAYVRYASEQRG